MLHTFATNRIIMASLTLRDIPADVFELIQQKQAEIKIKNGSNQFSLEKAVHSLIRETKKKT